MYAFKDFPEIVQKYGVNGIVPNNIPCHPTPVYEFLICSLFFVVLWKNKERFQHQEGKLFALYLLLAGIERFSVEFLRLNPRFLFGLSEAQIIAVILILIGAVSLNSFNRVEKIQS
jgi:phosphatidylglycerol:prolipoprotein diacylglycerol transferase